MTATVGEVSMLVKVLGLANYDSDEVVYLNINLDKVNVYDKASGRLIKRALEEEFDSVEA